MKLADKNLYTASIGGMRLRLAKLQELDEEAQKIRAESLDGYKNIDRVLHHQELLFVPKIIQTELITRSHNNPLARHFSINKTRKLIGKKYHWPSLGKDVETYVKGCDVCLALKAVKHNPYSDLQALLVSNYQWKYLSRDFMTILPVSIN